MLKLACFTMVTLRPGGLHAAAALYILWSAKWCPASPGAGCRRASGYGLGRSAAGQAAGTAGFAAAAVPLDLLTRHTLAAYSEGAMWGACPGSTNTLGSITPASNTACRSDSDCLVLWRWETWNCIPLLGAAGPLPRGSSMVGATGFPSCSCSVGNVCTMAGWAGLLVPGLLEWTAWDAGTVGMGCWSS